MQGLTMNPQEPSETQAKLLRPGTVDFGAAAAAFMNAMTAAGSGSGSVPPVSGEGPGGQDRAEQAVKQELQGDQARPTGPSGVSDEELEDMEKQVQEHRLK